MNENDFEGKWLYSELLRGNIHSLMILGFKDHGSSEIIFQVQLPMDIEEFSKDHSWHDLGRNILGGTVSELREVLPYYMNGICLEHNGVGRLANFPDLNISHLKMRPNSACFGIELNGEYVQLAGGDMDSLGNNFMIYFLRGLSGEWDKGIDFTPSGLGIDE